MALRVKINGTKIQSKVNKIMNDKATMLHVNNTFARYMDPYVPMDTGTLSQTLDISEKGVRYRVPYAHYQYEGTNFNFSKEMHPKACAHWDKKMMQERGKAFEKEVEKILQWRANQV